jgi:hypothetical protein
VDVSELQGEPDKAPEKKPSWWKRHPKLSVATVGIGAVAGAGMFAVAYAGYRVARTILRIDPFKST